jgi:hypothetical protein
MKRSNCGRAFLIRKRQSAQIDEEAYASHPALRRPSSIWAWLSGRCHGSSPADKHVESCWCHRSGLRQHSLCFLYANCLAEDRGCASTRRWPRGPPFGATPETRHHEAAPTQVISGQETGLSELSVAFILLVSGIQIPGKWSGRIGNCPLPALAQKIEPFGTYCPPN